MLHLIEIGWPGSAAALSQRFKVNVECNNDIGVSLCPKIPNCTVFLARNVRIYAILVEILHKR
jgi:hypothetical protein